MAKQLLKRTLYLPYSPEKKVYLILHPFDRKDHYPTSSERLSLGVLKNTLLHERSEMPDILKKLKRQYPDIRAVKISMSFEETNLIG